MKPNNSCIYEVYADGETTWRDAVALKQDLINGLNPLPVEYVNGVSKVGKTGRYSDLLNVPNTISELDARAIIAEEFNARTALMEQKYINKVEDLLAKISDDHEALEKRIADLEAEIKLLKNK